MLHPDIDTQRQLVRERQAELKRDWRASNAAPRALVETRRPPRQARLQWLAVLKKAPS